MGPLCGANAVSQEDLRDKLPSDATTFPPTLKPLPAKAAASVVSIFAFFKNLVCCSSKALKGKKVAFPSVPLGAANNTTGSCVISLPVNARWWLLIWTCTSGYALQLDIWKTVCARV